MDKKWKVGKAQDLGGRDCSVPNSCSLISTDKGALWPHEVTNWQYRSRDNWIDSKYITVQGKLSFLITTKNANTFNHTLRQNGDKTHTLHTISSTLYYGKRKFSFSYLHVLILL